MATTLASLVVRIGTDVTGVTRGFNETEKRTRALQRQFNSMRMVVAATAGALTGAAVAMGKLSERGGEVLTVQNAFGRMTGQQVNAINELRAATHNLIADYDLMRQANMALTLGSAGNVKQFAELAGVAQRLGRALGLDAAFALESLNIGIARQSRLVLDNLGIIVSAEKANQRYAASLGRTVASLSDAERAEAFRIEAMRQAEIKTEELGGVTLNTGDAFKELVVEIKNTVDWMAKQSAASDLLRIGFLSAAEGARVLRGEQEAVNAMPVPEVFGDLTTDMAQMEADIARMQGLSAEAMEALARNEGRPANLLPGEESIEAITAGMREFMATIQGFSASLAPVREFNAEMDLLEMKLLAIGEVAEPAIFSLTGGLSDLGVPTQLLSQQHLPDLQTEILETHMEFLALLTTLENTKYAMDEVNAAVDGFGKAQRGLGILGGLGRFLGVSIPYIGNVGGLISAGSAFAGFFAEGGTIPPGQVGVVGERGPELVRGPATVSPSASMRIAVHVGPARDPISFARDQQWQRAIAEANRELASNGFNFDA